MDEQVRYIVQKVVHKFVHEKGQLVQYINVLVENPSEGLAATPPQT